MLGAFWNTMFLTSWLSIGWVAFWTTWVYTLGLVSSSRTTFRALPVWMS